MGATYNDNTVLWRLRSPDGVPARVTFIPGTPENTLAWFVGNTLERVENHASWESAVERAEETRAELLASGWREEE